jgi:hypothetical protein
MATPPLNASQPLSLELAPDGKTLESLCSNGAGQLVAFVVHCYNTEYNIMRYTCFGTVFELTEAQTFDANIRTMLFFCHVPPPPLPNNRVHVSCLSQPCLYHQFPPGPDYFDRFKSQPSFLPAAISLVIFILACINLGLLLRQNGLRAMLDKAKDRVHLLCATLLPIGMTQFFLLVL